MEEEPLKRSRGPPGEGIIDKELLRGTMEEKCWGGMLEAGKPWKRNHVGSIWELSEKHMQACIRDHVEATMEEISWGRNHGEGITGKVPCRSAVGEEGAT